MDAPLLPANGQQATTAMVNKLSMEHGAYLLDLIKIRKVICFIPPASRQLYISANILFNERFSSTIVHTWQLHHDSLVLRPVSSDIPLTTTTIKHTSKVAQPIVKEGTSTPAETTKVEAIIEPHDDDNVPDLLDPNDDNSMSDAEYDSDSNSEIDD